MSTRKLHSNYNLVVTAHADDETIFFGGLLLSRQKIPWRIVCVTDGNADGQGAIRKKQFEKACRQLKVKHSDWLGLPDIYEQRLNSAELIEFLKALPPPQEIFTHGILGEYGHPHHQDVSFAVHQAFAKHPALYSVAWNCFPDLLVKISPADFKKKAQVLADVYGTETRRFYNFLPNTAVEGFARIKKSEVDALYDFFKNGQPLKAAQLKHFRWLWTHFQEQGSATRPRPF